MKNMVPKILIKVLNVYFCLGRSVINLKEIEILIVIFF